MTVSDSVVSLPLLGPINGLTVHDSRKPPPTIVTIASPAEELNSATKTREPRSVRTLLFGVGVDCNPCIHHRKSPSGMPMSFPGRLFWK